MFENRQRITIENAYRVRQSAVIEHIGARSLAWSPDGKILAVGDWQKIDWTQPAELRLVDKPTSVWLYSIDAQAHPLQRLVGHQNTIGGLAFSPDGGILASAAFDTTVRFWEVQTGRACNQLSIPGYSMHDLAFSPDGVLLAAGGSEEGSDPGSGTGVLAIWDVETGAREVQLEYEDWVGYVLFNPEGNLLAYSNIDGSVRIWDVGKKQKRAYLKGAGGPALVKMKFSSQELILFPADDYRSSVQTWNWSTGEHQIIASLPYTARFGPAIHPSESLIAVIHREGNGDVVHLVNWASEDRLASEPLKVLESGNMSLSQIEFSPDGRVLAMAEQQAIRLWTVE